MDIKEYLSKAMSLELSLYEQKRIINELYLKRKYIADNPGYKSHQSFSFFEKRSLSENGIVIIASVVIISIISIIICMRYDLKDASPGYVLFFWWAPILVGCLIGIPCGAIVGVIISAVMNIPLNRKEQLRIQKENDNIYNYNKSVDDYNNKCSSVVKSKISIINKEIQALESNYNKTNSTLKSLYNINIIYPKYRYMVAIFTFYEYFDSGRCSKLEGHEGAYNIFENELRFGEISDKLDVIVQKLNEISQAQYELRNAIYESNNRVSSIVNEVGLISNQLKDISHSVKLTEYNAYRGKECAEALAWVKSYELLSSKSF